MQEMQITHVDISSSTNVELARRCEQQPLPAGFTLWADFQTTGKGQAQNTWESEAGKNLTFSTLLYPTEIAASRQFLISETAALAVCDALSHYADGFCVKWPNDIYWHDQKICGILIEHVLYGNSLSRSIIGIGLNVNQDCFFSDAPNPVSLCHITGLQTSREKLLITILSAIQSRYAQAVESPDKLHAIFLQRLYRRQGIYSFRDAQGMFRASIETVLSDGILQLRDVEGRLRYYAFKEVSWL